MVSSFLSSRKLKSLMPAVPKNSEEITFSGLSQFGNPAPEAIDLEFFL